MLSQRATPRPPSRVPWWTIGLFLAPTLVFLLVFTYLPIGYALLEGWPHLKEVLRSPDTLRAARITLLYTFVVVPSTVLLGLVSALLVEGTTRVKLFSRAVLFHPVILPMVAFASMWLYFLNPTSGPLTLGLSALLGRRVSPLTDVDLTLYTVAAVAVLKDFGLYMLFFLAGLQSIPRQLYEAALVDGAGAWVRFTRITLPLLGPTLFFVGVFATMTALRNVDHIWILTPQGGVTGEAEVFLFHIYMVGFFYYNLPKASALSILFFFLFTLIALISIPRIEKGIYYAD
ncbi:MAG: ABC transporter permease [Candidatus Tectimicrobiota bacterium]|nr:MAG: ABC transporter permease [Candidatus Tectomicrobia bacterium]